MKGDSSQGGEVISKPKCPPRGTEATKVRREERREKLYLGTVERSRCEFARDEKITGGTPGKKGERQLRLGEKIYTKQGKGRVLIEG